MTREALSNGQTPAPENAPGPAELIDRLNRFQGAPHEFLVNLLAVQCHLSGAQGGAILRPAQSGRFEVMAVFPPLPDQSTAPVWLAQAVAQAGEVLASGTTVTRELRDADELYGQPAQRNLVMIPLRSEKGVRGIASFTVEARGPALEASRERLEITVSLLSLYEMRLSLQRRGADLRRLRMAMEVFAAFNEQDRFTGSAMALCNEIASRWQCERVSLGFLQGRYVKVKALNHTEKFSRKMQLVQDIEASMEECLDQDIEIVHPSQPEATYVSRSAADLSKRHGPTWMLSMPLRKAGEPLAVITVERSADRPMNLEEIEALRLTGDLCTARLLGLHETDRWIGARAAAGSRKAISSLLGAKHTWLKVIAILVLAFAGFLLFARGDYNAEAPFVLEAAQRQVVPSPFDGYIKHVYVDRGDKVVGSSGRPSWLIRRGDVPDIKALADDLLASADADTASPRGHVYSLLSEETKNALSRVASGAEDHTAKDAVIDGINGLLGSERLYDSIAWKNLSPTKRQMDLLKWRDQGVLDAARLVELNRSLLVGAFERTILPPPTVLADLDVSEMRLKLSSARVERAGHLKRASAAMRDGKTVEAQIARADAERTAAQIRLLEYYVRKAIIVAPTSGIVLIGELERKIGSPVKTGDVLFEVAPLESLRAELAVPEDRIGEVQLDQGGALAVESYPGEHVAFVVERISPIAEVVDRENAFKVRVRLKDRRDWMRPGMAGLAKIHIGRRRYAWIWTRRVVNWIRMKLWW